jgi:hypothetical protein
MIGAHHPNTKSNKIKQNSTLDTRRLLANLAIKYVNPEPSGGPASSRVDPFNVLPLDGRGVSQSLIFQCRLGVCYAFRQQGTEQSPDPIDYIT